MSKKKVVYYINQFFGQYGGEDTAGMATVVRDGAVGPAMNFEQTLGDCAEVVATIICGDNYFNEHIDAATDEIIEIIRRYQPDIVIAGPAFTAGRYGVACGSICAAVEERLGIPTVTGMYPENPGAEMFKANLNIIETSNNARSMRKEIQKIAALAKKLLNHEPLGSAAEEGTLFRGLVRNVVCEKKGVTRAVDMLLAKVNGEAFETETPMIKFDRVEKAPAIADLHQATIAIATDGGLYPTGNPDKMPFINSNRFAAYPIEGERLESGSYCVLHRGYDNTYVLDDPNRLVPADALLELEKQGVIGTAYRYFLTTTGLNTSLQNSKIIAKGMIERLRADHVDGVLLTST